MTAFGAVLARFIIRTLFTVRRCVALLALHCRILTALEIEINELGDKIFFRRNGSQVTQVIIQYVYFAGTTVIFAALMFFLFSFFDVDDFVTGTAFPPFFTLGRSAHFSFVLSFFV